MADLYRLLHPRFVSEGVRHAAGDVVALSPDEAALALAQGTAVPVEVEPAPEPEQIPVAPPPTPPSDVIPIDPAAPQAESMPPTSRAEKNRK